MALLADSEVDSVIAGLVRSISTSDRPTIEQTHSAAAVQRPHARLRFAEIALTLELCRHPGLRTPPSRPHQWR